MLMQQTPLKSQAWLQTIAKQFAELSHYESTAFVFILKAWRILSSNQVITDKTLTYDDFFSHELKNTKLHNIFSTLAKEHKVFSLFIEQFPHFDKLDMEILNRVFILVESESLGNVNDAFFHYDSRRVPSVSHQVAALGVQLLDSNESTIYMPFTPDFTVAYHTDKTIHAEGEGRGNQLIAELIKVIDDKEIIYNVTDPLRAPSYQDDQATHLLKKFKAVISFPPFNQKGKLDLSNDKYNRFKLHRGTNLNIAHFEHILAQTKEKAVVLMPVGFTYRSGADEAFRRDLVEKNWLEAIVQLPTNVHTGTSIETTFFIINKLKVDNNVQFISLKGDTFTQRDGRRTVFKDIDTIFNIYKERTDVDNIAALVSNEEVVANDYSLAVDRYVLSKEAAMLQKQLEKYELIELQEIADIRRSQLFKDELDGFAVTEVGPSDLSHSGETKPEGKVKHLDKQLNKLKTYALQQDDIVLSTKGTIGKVGLISCLPNSVIASQAMQVIRLKEGSSYDPITLYMYIKSDLGQAMLKQLVSGVAMPQISTVDIKKFKVPLLSKEEIVKVHDDYFAEHEHYAKIAKSQEDIKKIHSNFLGEN